MDTLEFTCNGMEFVFQCEHHSWSFRGEADALGNAYCSRHILLLLWSNRWVEICIPLSLSHACTHTLYVTHTHLYFGKDRANFLFVFLIIPLQESAREKSQKYKEGKFVLERYMRCLSFIHSNTLFLLAWRLASSCSFIYTVTICVSIYNRGRIVDEIDFSTEVYIDTRPSVSDAEEWSSETAKFVASFLQNVVPNILTIRTDTLLLYIYVWAVYLFGTTLAL